MLEKGFKDSIDAARTYLTHGNGEEVDAELIETMLYDGPKMIDFLRNQVGFTFTTSLPDYHPNWVGGVKEGRSITPAYKGKSGGQALMMGLYEYAVSKGVLFAFNCHAKGLIQDIDDKVIGVETLDLVNNQKKRIKAKKGVLLACGGFDWDSKLVRNYQRGPIVASACFPPMDGSALRMAQGVGADLANMNEAFGLVGYLNEGWESEVASYRKNIKDYKTSTWKNISADWFLWRGKPGAIVVNKYGKRFFNEACDYDTALYAFGDRETFGDCNWRNLPAYTIMDAESFKKNNLGSYAGTPTKAFVKSADTLEALAKLLDIDPTGLTATLDAYNANAAKGIDPDFHRGESYFDRKVSGDAAIFAKNPDDPAATLRPLGAGPYYAAQLYPITTGICGGARVNGKGQVYHATGVIIKGLYAAGNAAGVGGPGMTYPGPGGTIGPALTFGYVAAKTMAKG